MTDICEIKDAEGDITVSFQCADEQVPIDVSGEIADVGTAINGGPARIDRVGGRRGEKLLFYEIRCCRDVVLSSL